LTAWSSSCVLLLQLTSMPAPSSTAGSGESVGVGCCSRRQRCIELDCRNRAQRHCPATVGCMTGGLQEANRLGKRVHACCSLACRPYSFRSSTCLGVLQTLA
jgi:hypothetical protein